MAKQLQTQMQDFLAKCVEGMADEQKKLFRNEFPALQLDRKPRMADPVKRSSASVAEAFNEYKKLAERKRNIESKAAKLQQQLEKLPEQLAITTTELDKAQERHERELRTYAEVVQSSAQKESLDHEMAGCEMPPDYDPIRTSEDDNGSITGDEYKGEKPEVGTSQEETPTPMEFETPPQLTQEQEMEFQKFKDSLSPENRALLDRRLESVAVDSRPRASSSSPAQAKELLEMAKLMGNFVKVLQTQRG